MTGWLIVDVSTPNKNDIGSSICHCWLQAICKFVNMRTNVPIYVEHFEMQMPRQLISVLFSRNRIEQIEQFDVGQIIVFLGIRMNIEYRKFVKRFPFTFSLCIHMH